MKEEGKGTRREAGLRREEKRERVEDEESQALSQT